jgi:hypothetical protein
MVVFICCLDSNYIESREIVVETGAKRMLWWYLKLAKGLIIMFSDIIQHEAHHYTD